MSSAEMLWNGVHVCLSKKCCVAIQLCFGCFILALVMASSILTNHTGIANHQLRWEYWDERQFLHPWSLITKVFDISYIISITFSGFLCLRYSAGRLFGIAIAGLSVLHIMSLLTTSVGLPELVIVTFIKGLLMGLTLSSVITICNIQVSNIKNTTFISIIMFGFLFGYWLSEICFLNCGDYFWSLSFYIIGIVGLLWSACWFWLFKDVNNVAIYYIHDGVRASNFSMMKLLSSMPRLCITIVALCAMLNFSLMDYIVVLFIENQEPYPHKFGMRQFLTCTTAASALVVGWLSDFLRRYSTFSTTQVRKAFTCGGLFGSSLIIFLLLFFYTRQYGIMTLCSCIGVFYILQGTLVIAFLVNGLDIAPQFAGLVAGISFGSALIITEVIISITTRTFASYTSLEVDVYNRDLNTLFKAFVILLAFNISGGIFFFKFGSGEEQKWAGVQIEDNLLIENIPDAKIILEEEKQSQTI